MTLSAAPDYHPRPFHEIFSLTLRSMNSSWLWDYLAVKIPLTLKKLKITTNYDFSCGTSLPWLPPPLSTRFSHRPWQAWTLLDSEIFSWQKYLHNYHKLWLCLLCLITSPPPPWDFLAGPEKDELSLTVRLSRGQNPINLEKLDLSITFLIVQRFTIPDRFPGGWGSDPL